MLGVVVMSLCVMAQAMRECDKTKTVTIAGGYCLPFASNGDVMKHTPSCNDTMAASMWLKAGGRGLDTAWSYDHGGYGHSQRQNGVAIKASGINREEIFVTTKIPCGSTLNATMQLIRYDLDQLMLDYVDLLLIHTPHACKTQDDIATTWEGMHKAVELGMVKAIGVSNFDHTLLQWLANTSTVTPAVNQISLCVGNVDTATIQYCKHAGITVQAYSPLGHPDGGHPAVYNMPAVKAVAASHNVTGAQVAFRWLVQGGYPFVTASPSFKYDQEDLDIFGFTLTDSEMEKLDNV